MLPQNLLSSFFRRKQVQPTKKSPTVSFESLEPRIALAGGLNAAFILHSNQLSNYQQADANRDRMLYLKKQKLFHGGALLIGRLGIGNCGEIARHWRIPLANHLSLIWRPGR